MTMSEQVANAIRAAIRDHGPITFAEFMELALYGPGGYYERPPVGDSGDFVTSPHVHPVFGRLLAVAIRSLHGSLGLPSPLRIVEAGAGDGTLAAQVLAGLDDLDIEYTAVDVSRGAREALDTIGGVLVANELGGEPHVLIANELLDNLPFRRLRGDREVRVAVDERDRLVESETVWDGTSGSPGRESIDHTGAFAFIDRLASVLTRGYALLIDYGHDGSVIGDVHGYRDHRVIEDVLSDPGSVDITVGVDFRAIARCATERGMVAYPTVSQHDALRSLGFDEWLRAERDRQVSLLKAREGLEAVRTWGGRSRATLLVDPAALGRLRWLVLASRKLPKPGWLP
jgi:SAM-dependent MidA family methyltransferase